MKILWVKTLYPVRLIFPDHVYIASAYLNVPKCDVQAVCDKDLFQTKVIHLKSQSHYSHGSILCSEHVFCISCS